MDTYQQWRELCKKFEAAREEHFKAFAIVSGAFAQIAKGVSKNPSTQELDNMEKSWSYLEGAKKEMDEFLKKNN
jgi:hypothetical protein